jgi:transmembrane sensor
MTPLRLPLKDHLSDPVDERALERIAQAIDVQPAAGRRRWWLVPGAAAAGIALATFVIFMRAPGPLVLADGRTVEAIESVRTAQVLALADGSRIRLAPGARIEPLASTGTTFSALLTRGSAEFEVRPGGPRHWVIECGLATVEVVGTVFACERAPGRLRVVVQRGVVVVRGDRVPDRVRRLVAGQSLVIAEEALAPPPAKVAPPEHAATSQVDETPVTAPVRAERSPMPPAKTWATSRVDETPATVPVRAESNPMPSAETWRALARHGRHGEAFAMLGTDGLHREANRLGVDDLLALADVARLSGHPHEAVAPLERILTEFAGDGQAPLAAFALGRIELDGLNRPKAAAAALQKALALGIPRSLREDVRARLVEAHARAGDATAARSAAAAYADEFPHGRHAHTIEGWLRPR